MLKSKIDGGEDLKAQYAAKEKANKEKAKAVQALQEKTALE